MSHNVFSAPIIAALDVGSNSVRLLVARPQGGTFVPVHAGRITSRLYQGLSNGLLHPESIDRTARAIETLAAEARAHGAQEVLAFGTSAMRDGQNRADLIDAAARIGVPIEVISGAEEAEISYRGAAPGGCAGVIDIGGGSTELLTGEGGRMLAVGSAQIGAVRLMESLGGLEDPSAMIRAAELALIPARDAVADRPVERWIGLGGTITTLAAMQLRLAVYDPAAIESHMITAASATDALQSLISTPLPHRRTIPGMNPARADIMPFGLAILVAFFHLVGAPAVYASDRDNLLGFLMKKRPEMLDNPSKMG